MTNTRYKKCPACAVYFDTWDVRETWSRQTCLSTAKGDITHYEAYNIQAATILRASN